MSNSPYLYSETFAEPGRHPPHSPGLPSIAPLSPEEAKWPGASVSGCPQNCPPVVYPCQSTGRFSHRLAVCSPHYHSTPRLFFIPLDPPHTSATILRHWVSGEPVNSPPHPSSTFWPLYLEQISPDLAQLHRRLSASIRRRHTHRDCPIPAPSLERAKKEPASLCSSETRFLRKYILTKYQETFRRSRGPVRRPFRALPLTIINQSPSWPNSDLRRVLP